jgi:hypothetical protein
MRTVQYHKIIGEPRMADKAKPAEEPPRARAISGRFPQLRRTLFAFAPQVFAELVRRDRRSDAEPLPGARVSAQRTAV